LTFVLIARVPPEGVARFHLFEGSAASTERLAMTDDVASG
jgi:hypothetical protein